MRTILWRLVRSTIQVDASGLSLRSGAFASLGVVVPLVVGLLAGDVLLGAVGAIGALLVGFAGFQRGYRSRLVTMSIAAVVVAACTVAGNIIHNQLAFSALFYVVVGAAAGAALAFGEAASTIGIQALVAFAIGSGLGAPTSLSSSLAVATILGAFLQVILTAIAIVTSRSPIECRALGQVYSSLARYASSTDLDRAPNPHLISVLQDSLIDPQPFRDRRNAILLDLTVLAANLRSRLAMLRVAQAGDVVAGLDSNGIRVTELTTRVCAQVVEFSRGHHNPSCCQALKSELGEITELLTSQADHADLDILIHLLADLSEVVDVLLGLEVRRDLVQARGKRSVYNPFESRFSSSSRSVVIRHALRLASALVIADALVYLLGVGHGYWGPMTVALVLRPQNVSTVERGLFRILGTVLGVAATTAIVILFAPTVAILVVIVAGVTWAGFATFRANYFLYSISITAVVVLLFVVLGAAATTVALDRLIDTLLGGAIAMIVSFVAPTWISEPLPALVRSTMLAQARFIEFLGAHWAEDGRQGYALLETARRKRVLAIEALNAAAQEAPIRRNPRNVTRERQLLIQLDRSSLALLALQSLSAQHALSDPSRMQELISLSKLMRDAAASISWEPLADQPVNGNQDGTMDNQDGAVVQRSEVSLADLPFQLLIEAGRNIESLVAD